MSLFIITRHKFGLNGTRLITYADWYYISARIREMRYNTFRGRVARMLSIFKQERHNKRKILSINANHYESTFGSSHLYETYDINFI